MRINVYSQELTADAALVQEKGYHAVRMFLHSSDRLHHEPGNDDRSGVTFWLPKSPDRRETLAQTFEQMATLVREAPPEDSMEALLANSEARKDAAMGAALALLNIAPPSEEVEAAKRALKAEME